jgi:hypothetical protein
LWVFDVLSFAASLLSLFLGRYFAVLNTRELELYLSNTDLQSGKPPKEVVALTPDCTVESRKLAASAKPRPPASSSEGGHVSPFGEGGEPDSVIDLQMTASKTGSPRVVTLQCFSVEEENKWISHLQASQSVDLVAPSAWCPCPGWLGLALPRCVWPGLMCLLCVLLIR